MYYRIFPNYSDKSAQNSVDPDLRGVSSGSILFATKPAIFKYINIKLC